MKWFKVLKVIWKVVNVFAKIKEQPKVDEAVGIVEDALKDR